MKRNFGQSYTINDHIKGCINLKDVAKNREKCKVGEIVGKLYKNAVFLRFSGDS